MTGLALTDSELRDALIGRTICGVEVNRPGGSWAFGDGDVSLILDDGRRVEFRSEGHDSCGMDAYCEGIK